jgi:hypothetical protein
MTPDPPAALEQALEQSHDVKAKVEACAGDLALQNEAVQQEIANGATTLPADQALQDSQAVEATVQECADDLDEVTATLARGIADIKQVEVALTRSRVALAEAETALLTAQEDERHATMRALHDPATGLPNRVLFDDRVTQGISLAERHGWSLAVMFLDLDRFKSINDDHGHAAGDLVLREVTVSRNMRATKTRFAAVAVTSFFTCWSTRRAGLMWNARPSPCWATLPRRSRWGGVASSSARASGSPCIRVTARRSTSSSGTPTRRCIAPRTVHAAMSCSARPGTAPAPDTPSCGVYAWSAGFACPKNR